MRILCVIDSLGSGGAQRQLTELAIAFKERGHRVSFIVYHNITFFKEILDEHGIEIKVIEEANVIKRIFKIRKYIRSQNADAILSFLEASNFICELSGFPFRSWKLLVGERSSNPNISKSFSKILYRWTHLLADYVVANSNRNIEMVRKINPLLSKNKCHVIYNIVDEQKWDVKVVESEKKEVFNLVVAASHQYLKNADGLIEAVNLLSNDEKKRLRISWYGGGSNDDSHSQALLKVKDLDLENIISFYPPTSEIKNVFLKSDAVGLFSFYEGLPNVVCEAMMVGKPVIASSVSDVPLLLDKDVVFDPYDVQDIATKLKYFLNLTENQLHQFGTANKMKAKRIFNKSDIVDKYLKLLTT